MAVISVITVVFNGKDLLEGTIKSVLAQDYPAIEYIIVDGKSTDGTLEIIQQYEGKISQCISEKDHGLYDAMNKGLRLATGDYVWFMNCGDRIFEVDTISKMMAKAQDADVIYGEVMLVDDNRKHVGTRTDITHQKLPTKLSWKSMSKGMVVCHQAFLPKRILVEPYVENNLTADIDWVIKILKKAETVKATDLILAEYLMGGISKTRHQQSLKDRYQVLSKHFGFFPNLWNHFLIVLRSFGKSKY